MDLSFLSPYKITKHPEIIESLKNGEIVYPIQVEIHPTLMCNHNCYWCITNKTYTDKQLDIIPFEKLYSLITEFSEVGVKTLTFSGGGEPLLYKDFHTEFINKVWQKNYRISFETNGSIEPSEELKRYCHFTVSPKENENLSEVLKRFYNCYYDLKINILSVIQ